LFPPKNLVYEDYNERNYRKTNKKNYLRSLGKSEKFIDNFYDTSPWVYTEKIKKYLTDGLLLDNEEFY
jgi:hypothetical protein